MALDGDRIYCSSPSAAPFCLTCTVTQCLYDADLEARSLQLLIRTSVMSVCMVLVC